MYAHSTVTPARKDTTIIQREAPKARARRHRDPIIQDSVKKLAVINYTSGTTSYSKGVMLPYRSLWSNTRFAFEVLPLKAGDKLVCMLPMAHMYGLAFEFLYEFSLIQGTDSRNKLQRLIFRRPDDRHSPLFPLKTEQQIQNSAYQ